MFMLLKLEPVVLSLTHLVQVIIQRLLRQAHLLSSCIESIDALSPRVNLLV